MFKPFKIYTDRLNDGHVEKINELVSSSFLDADDKELHFDEMVEMVGETYLAEDNLVIHLKIKTTAFIPCSICNEPVAIPLLLDNFYHTEELGAIPSGVFDFSFAVRDSILLQVPLFAECHGGNCPEREILNKFLTKPEEKQSFPFSDLK